jgi:hypothetical protein
MSILNEIIVTANPMYIDSGNQVTPSGYQPVQAQAQQVALSYQARPSFKQNSDVTDPAIVVIGQRLKNAMTTFYVNFALGANYPILLPCIGNVNRSELASILWNLSFTATTTDYGTGRAGANNVGVGDSAVPVDINYAELKNYDALAGGLDYLTLHETAHALVAMQAYDRSMWNSYIAGPGKSLTAAQRIAQYPNSAQFMQNEARANTIAKALNQFVGKTPWAFTPTNGYQVC